MNAPATLPAFDAEAAEGFLYRSRKTLRHPDHGRLVTDAEYWLDEAITAYRDLLAAGAEPRALEVAAFTVDEAASILYGALAINVGDDKATQVLAGDS